MKQPQSIFLSIIIPMYNEAPRISLLFAELKQYLNQKSWTYEVIAVDDGSLDNTSKISHAHKSDHFRHIQLPINQGKGFAIRKGVELASGKYILFMDADLSTHISEFDRFLPILETENIDIALGTRRQKESTIVKHQSALRSTLGRGYIYLTQLLLGLKVSDINCGFKCFRRFAATQLFQKQTIWRWGFDAEILFLAHKYGYHIKEIPVTWKDSSSSAVSIVKACLSSFTELLKIRINNIRGIYS